MKISKRARHGIFIASSLILFVLVASTLTLSQSPPPEISYGEYWEQSCSNGICNLFIFQHQKYFFNQSLNDWGEINESFSDCSSRGARKFCTRNYYFNANVDSQGRITASRSGGSQTMQLTSFLNYSLDFSNPQVQYGQVTYNVVPRYIDLLYQYGSRTLKEEIVILQPLPISERNFTITFSKDDSTAFYLTPIVACDAMDVCTIFPSDDLGTQFTIQVPGEWLFSENRTYPITIDPTISLDNESILWDGYVKQQIQLGVSNPYARTNTPSVLKCGFRQEPNPTLTQDNFSCASEWNISAIPDNVNITELIVQFRVSQLGTDGNSKITFKEMDLLHEGYPNTETDCAGNCLFWKDMQNGTDLSVEFTITGTGNQNFTLNTQGIQDITSHLSIGTWSFGLRQHFDSAYPANASVSELRLDARDATNPVNRPVLYVVYNPFATETEGRSAIEQGIQSILGNTSIETDEKFYIINENDDQYNGSFDKTVEETNQTWIFNYVTEGETMTNIPSLKMVVNVWENQSLYLSEITEQVGEFLNSTRAP